MWLFLPINPEPWAIGDVSAGRRNGGIFARVSPNPNLQAFQNAVREELEGLPVSPMLPPGQYELKFWFKRKQERYLDAADHKRQRNQADATNLQKGLEDALQGKLFDNDRDVRKITSEIIDQGTHVKHGYIVIFAEEYKGFELSAIPLDVLETIKNLGTESLSPNTWGVEGEDLF